MFVKREQGDHQADDKPQDVHRVVSANAHGAVVHDNHSGPVHRLPDAPEAYGAMITRAKAAPAQSRSADLVLNQQVRVAEERDHVDDGHRCPNGQEDESERLGRDCDSVVMPCGTR